VAPWVHIGPAVRLVRLARRMTGREVASRASLADATLSHFERGQQRQPRFETALSCLQALGALPEELAAAFELLYSVPKFLDGNGAARPVVRAALHRVRCLEPSPGRRSFRRVPPIVLFLGDLRKVSLNYGDDVL